MRSLPGRFATPTTRRLTRAVLVLAAFALTAATASAKSAGCAAVPVDFPAGGATLNSGASQVINTFAAGEVIAFDQISGSSSILVTQGDGTTIATNSFPGNFLATPITASGIASVTVTNNGANTVTLSAVCNAPSRFTVTVTSDPVGGTASNCTAGSTTDPSCSLRDAVAAVNTLSGAASTIFFSPAVVGTITLTHGPLELTVNTVVNITGPGANFLAISGNGASAILEFDPHTTATVSGLTFTGSSGNAAIATTGAGSSLAIAACAFNANQNSGNNGGAVFASGSGPLTITSSSFSGNTAAAGGAVFANAGTVTVNNSTFTGNSSTSVGGAILALGLTVTMTNTTIAANHSASGGGIFLTGGALTLANTAIAGNTATGANADLSPGGATITDNGGNYFSTDAAAASTLNPMLLPLANYGGPVQTRLPAPLSPLLCQGTAANATAAGLTLDERNDPRTTIYGGTTTCVDIGATQSNYSLGFAQSPPATVTSGLAITPSPTVQWKESTIALPSAGQPIAIAATAGTLSGTTPQSTNASGIATFPGLSIATTETNDTLQATLPLSTSPAISVSATSSAFNVSSPITSFAITALPSTATAGTAVGFTVTALNGSSTATLYTGTITISSAQDPLLAFVGGGVMYTFTAGDAGVHTFSIANGAVFKTAGSDTLTVTDTGFNVAATSGTITVSAAAPALLSTISGSGQSVPIGGTFTVPLKVKVTDIFANPNNGVNVTYAGPGSGAGIVPATSVIATGTDGTASLSAIANATASATAYTVTATVTGLAPVSFTLTNTQAASAITIAQVAPLPVSNGTGVGVPTTLVATLSDATQNSAGLPTGTVQFYNGTPLTGTPIGAPVAIVNAQAVLTTTFPATGTFNITAQYLGDSNFTGSTSSALVEVVTAPSYTISLSPTSLTIAGGGNASTTITITPVGNYQGTLTFSCSGLVSYSSCAFQAPAIALTGSNTPQQVTLTLFTLGPSNAASIRSGAGTTRDAGLLWLPGIALATLLLLRRRKLVSPLLTLLLLAGTMLGLSGCFGTQHFFTPTGTDLVTVTSTGIATPGSGSTNLNQTAPLTLIVQ
jgi:large repetitive protein